MTGEMTTSEVFAHHFPRLFADRNSDRVVVFANGHTSTRESRRAQLRRNVETMRRNRVREAAEAARWAS